MDEQFTRSYSILDLQPGASWDELRSAYRSLVKTWHPDRFQLDSERRRAEEKTKEITRAYKTLADYYRKHGQTPADGAAPQSEAERSAAARAADDQAVEIPDKVDMCAGKNAYHPTSDAPRHPFSWKTLTALITAALLIYLWLLDGPSENTLNSDAFPGSPTLEVPEARSIGSFASQSATQFFTHDTTIGDVYSIQGIPSKIEKGIWHYGKSKVYFIDGRVSRWESHPDNPLKASLDVEPIIRSNEIFTRGSTKAEVMTLQGRPWRQTEHEWAYGSSRIFFTGGLVTGWEESPLYPLKTSR